MMINKALSYLKNFKQILNMETLSLISGKKEKPSQLSLGRQTFEKLIKENCIYVDKTDKIYSLISSGKSFFLSRPRRFGKSMLTTTLKQIFLGNKEFFKYDNALLIIISFLYYYFLFCLM